MYCVVDDVIKYLPKPVRDTLLAESNYEIIVNEKISIAQDYITFILLNKKDYLITEEITPDIKMLTAELSALYVIEYYIHIAPESLGIDFSQPNYKAVIINKINELKEFVKEKYYNGNIDALLDIEKSFYGLFIPKEREEKNG